MSLTLAVNNANDIFVGADGLIATNRDLAAVAQAAAHAARTLLAEKIYATDEGVPYFEAAWNGAPNLSQFEAYLRRAFLSVDGVTRVGTVTVSNASNTLSYSAQIQTVYGAASING